MMASALGFVYDALSKPGALALGVALLWGVASVALSPCHLGAIPLVVAYMHGGSRPARATALRYSFLFALGILITLGLVGFGTALAGRLMGDLGRAPSMIVAACIVLAGLWLMDLPWLSRFAPSWYVRPRGRGAFGAFALGLGYGIVLGPCAFAFLAPLLGFVMSASMGAFAFGLSLQAAYALGHTMAITAAGVFGREIVAWLSARERNVRHVRRALGAIVVVAGIAQLL